MVKTVSVVALRPPGGSRGCGGFPTLGGTLLGFPYVGEPRFRVSGSTAVWLKGDHFGSPGSRVRGKLWLFL